jgi:hypothetical protein
VHRSGWIALGLSLVMLAAALKLLFVDRATDIIAYPIAGSVGFALVALLMWLRGGEVAVTAAGIELRPRHGGGRTVPLAGLTDVKIVGRRTKGRDHLVLHFDRRHVHLHRVQPLSLRDVIRAAAKLPRPRPPEGRHLPQRVPAAWDWLPWWLCVASVALFTRHANGWLAVNLTLLYMASVTIVVVHELSHLMVGRWLGFDVHWLSIGTGPEVARFQLGGVLVVLFAVPFSGKVFMTTTERADLRRRRMLVSAAGSCSEFFFFTVGIVACLLLGFGDFTLAPAPFAMLACTAIGHFAGTALAGFDGIHTDMVNFSKLARAGEAELDRRFAAEVAENRRWKLTA